MRAPEGERGKNLVLALELSNRLAPAQDRTFVSHSGTLLLGCSRLRMEACAIGLHRDANPSLPRQSRGGIRMGREGLEPSTDGL